MTGKLAAMLKAAYGVEAGYFSVLNSDNPSEIPTFNTDVLDNRVFYNYWFDNL